MYTFGECSGHVVSLSVGREKLKEGEKIIKRMKDEIKKKKKEMTGREEGILKE